MRTIITLLASGSLLVALGCTAIPINIPHNDGGTTRDASVHPDSAVVGGLDGGVDIAEQAGDIFPPSQYYESGAGDGPVGDALGDGLATDGLPTDGLQTDGLQTDGLQTDGLQTDSDGLGDGPILLDGAPLPVDGGGGD